MLRGLGLVSAVALVPGAAGCIHSGSDLPTAQSTTCGTDVCIDTTVAHNSALASPGGAMLVDVPGDTIMVIRVSDTEVVALSAICTHAGCSMNFDASQQLLVCPCHGSEFDETGTVVHGPARRPVQTYMATLASGVITIGA